MTLSTTTKTLRAAAALGVAATALALAGCGGATSGGSNLVAQKAAGPTIYGLEPSGVVVGGEFFETSGFANAAASKGYLTGAVASTAKPPASVTVNGTIPLGFAPSGTYIDNSTSGAVLASSSVIFGSYISNGYDTSGNLIPISPASVVLTSPEVPGFSQSMAFTNNFSGPLANAQYRTGTFTLPFATAGLHKVVASVGDTAGESSTTTFDIAVVTAAVGCVLVNSTSGAAASITGDAGVTEQKTGDAQGVIILFAAPGNQTLTVGGKNVAVVVTGGATTTVTP